jgi:hypothetical protein
MPQNANSKINELALETLQVEVRVEALQTDTIPSF